MRLSPFYLPLTLLTLACGQGEDKDAADTQPEADSNADSSADSSADADSDTGSDTDTGVSDSPPVDTHTGIDSDTGPVETGDTAAVDTEPDEPAPGYVVLAWEGEIQGDGSTVSSGSWGYSFYPYDYGANTWDLTDLTCHMGTDLIAGAEIKACPGCDFYYSTEGASSGGLTGSHCDEVVAVVGDVSGYYAGYPFGLGFVEDYGGFGIPAMYLYLPNQPTYGWFLFNFNYGSTYTLALTSGTNASWTRVIQGDDGYPRYYDLTL